MICSMAKIKARKLTAVVNGEAPPGIEETREFLGSIEGKGCCGRGCMSCVKRTRATALGHLLALLDEREEPISEEERVLVDRWDAMC